jgi:hypothetical protein
LNEPKTISAIEIGGSLFQKRNKSYIMLYSLFSMGSTPTNSLKSLATGFFAMTAAVSVFSILAIARSGDAWLSMLYFLVLLIPLSGTFYLWQAGRKGASQKTGSYAKVSYVLFGLQGVALACWAYDLATTFYAINISRLAFEINPLGWPLGAMGALAYYAPTVILTYVLLFKIKQKTSLCAAIPITVIALLMGSMNLNAGLGNFRIFLIFASVPTAIRYNLLAIILAVDFGCAATLAAAARRSVFGRNRNVGLQKKG